MEETPKEIMMLMQKKYIYITNSGNQ